MQVCRWAVLLETLLQGLMPEQEQERGLLSFPVKPPPRRLIAPQVARARVGMKKISFQAQ